MTTQRVLIIGVGRIGQALTDLIRGGTSAATVLLWDKNPQLVADQQPLEELVTSADVIFCCTPSWTVRDILTTIREHLRPTTVVITLAKGCEASTGKTMAEVADELLNPVQPHGVLGGPMLAETLKSGHRGIGVIGSRDPVSYNALAPLFEGTRLQIVADADPNGVALAGVLKNIYAFLVGIGVGLGWTTDQQKIFFDRAHQEFLDVGIALGISPTTIHGPAGLEDFIETATSSLSHNHQVGEKFGHLGSLPGECEATISFPTIVQRLGDKSFPLISALRALLINHQPPATLASTLESVH